MRGEYRLALPLVNLPGGVKASKCQRNIKK